MLVSRLRLDVDRSVSVDRVHDRRQHHAAGIGAGKPTVAVFRPLHGRANAVPVAEMHVVAHADLVAVVNHGRARHRQKEAVHQLDPPPVVLQKRREPPSYAEIEPGTAVGRVSAPQIVALCVSHHLERQLVVIAEKNRPLGAGAEGPGSGEGCR